MNFQEVTILVVDDEAPVRKLLRRCFEAENYRVLEASTSEEMFSVLNENDVKLITLDISLGVENGLDLAKQIRRNSDVGIIIVSGKGELIDTLLGLEVGADDYISKPFELREVIARARSVLRRTNHTSAIATDTCEGTTTVSGYQFGEWSLFPSRRLVQKADGTEIELTTAEFDLLEVLITHSLSVLSRTQIMDMMKGQDWNPNDRSIDNHIANLRKKLDPTNSSVIIKSVRGVGYVFTLETNNI